MQDCHSDVLISEFKRKFPNACDRSTPRQAPPSARVMSFLADLRPEPESDEGSTEAPPPRGAGLWTWGAPMQVGLGHTARDFCDGQLASPGRWNPEDLKYPESERWTGVVELFRKYAETYTSAQLLVELSLGKVSLQVAIHFRVDLRAQERSHQARTIVRTENTQS